MEGKFGPTAKIFLGQFPTAGEHQKSISILYIYIYKKDPHAMQLHFIYSPLKDRVSTEKKNNEQSINI